MNSKNSERNTIDADEIRGDMRRVLKLTHSVRDKQTALRKDCDAGFEAFAQAYHKLNKNYWALWICVVAQALYLILK